MVESETKAKRGTIQAWRDRVAVAGRKIAQANGGPLTGAVAVDIRFYLARPKTITRAVPHVYPDIDKLARTVLDGLTDGGCWGDDGQVTELTVSKAYAVTRPPGCELHVTQL